MRILFHCHSQLKVLPLPISSFPFLRVHLRLRCSPPVGTSHKSIQPKTKSFQNVFNSFLIIYESTTLSLKPLTRIFSHLTPYFPAIFTQAFFTHCHPALQACLAACALSSTFLAAPSIFALVFEVVAWIC